MNDFLRAVTFISNSTWNLFRSVGVPGLGVSFAVLLSGMFFMNKAISFIKYLNGSYSNDDNNNKIYKR